MLATDARAVEEAAPPCPPCPERSACRRFLAMSVLGICVLVLLRALVVEPFHVPTGSMAPTLLGQHRRCDCPRCGAPVVVGRHPADRDGLDGPRRYDKAFCPNCGQSPLPLGVPETAGDHVLVNKTAFLLREPRRWEMIVFRLFGITFIKRVVGLPGETIELRGGDLYIDGRLARKTLAQAQAMQTPLFDLHQQPGPDGWQPRWEGELDLDGRAAPRTLTYRNFLLDERKCEPIRDEYSYNGGMHAGRETVHDFLVETVVALQAGSGQLALRLCDGQDWVETVLPVEQTGLVTARSWPLDDKAKAETVATGEALKLQLGRRYHLVLAFVDRRLSVRVEGRLVLQVDLPEPGERRGVERPFQLQVDGAAVQLQQFRLSRDVHYSQRGRNALAGQPVRLGPEQYFVLGDNSPGSEDSRFWPDQGAVPARGLIGRPFLVHLPGRLSDWDRLRWLH